jgi:hypothetical protein
MERSVEFFDPPYMAGPRPDYEGLPGTVDYGSEFDLDVSLPDGVESVDGKIFNDTSHFAYSNDLSIVVVILDLGFTTHGVHMVRFMDHALQCGSLNSSTFYRIQDS